MNTIFYVTVIALAIDTNGLAVGKKTPRNASPAASPSPINSIEAVDKDTKPTQLLLGESHNRDQNRTAALLIPIPPQYLNKDGSLDLKNQNASVKAPLFFPLNLLFPKPFEFNVGFNIDKNVTLSFNSNEGSQSTNDAQNTAGWISVGQGVTSAPAPGWGWETTSGWTTPGWGWVPNPTAAPTSGWSPSSTAAPGWGWQESSTSGWAPAPTQGWQSSSPPPTTQGWGWASSSSSTPRPTTTTGWTTTQAPTTQASTAGWVQSSTTPPPTTTTGWASTSSSTAPPSTTTAGWTTSSSTPTPSTTTVATTTTGWTSTAPPSTTTAPPPTTTEEAAPGWSSLVQPAAPAASSLSEMSGGGWTQYLPPSQGGYSYPPQYGGYNKPVNPGSGGINLPSSQYAPPPPQTASGYNIPPQQIPPYNFNAPPSAAAAAANPSPYMNRPPNAPVPEWSNSPQVMNSPSAPAAQSSSGPRPDPEAQVETEVSPVQQAKPAAPAAQESNVPKPSAPQAPTPLQDQGEKDDAPGVLSELVPSPSFFSPGNRPASALSQNPAVANSNPGRKPIPGYSGLTAPSMPNVPTNFAAGKN